MTLRDGASHAPPASPIQSRALAARTASIDAAMRSCMFSFPVPSERRWTILVDPVAQRMWAESLSIVPIPLVKDTNCANSDLSNSSSCHQQALRCGADFVSPAQERPLSQKMIDAKSSSTQSPALAVSQREDCAPSDSLGEPGFAKQTQQEPAATDPLKLSIERIFEGGALGGRASVKLPNGSLYAEWPVQRNVRTPAQRPLVLVKPHPVRLSPRSPAHTASPAHIAAYIDWHAARPSSSVGSVLPNENLGAPWLPTPPHSPSAGCCSPLEASAILAEPAFAGRPSAPVPRACPMIAWMSPAPSRQSSPAPKNNTPSTAADIEHRDSAQSKASHFKQLQSSDSDQAICCINDRSPVKTRVLRRRDSAPEIACSAPVSKHARIEAAKSLLDLNAND